MRRSGLSAALIAPLAAAPEAVFDGQGGWDGHLDRLGLLARGVAPEPRTITTEAALWGSIQAHGFLTDTVVLSDDAGQFNVGRHALCWVHAERLVHELDTFTDKHPACPGKAARPDLGLLRRPQGLSG